MTRSHHKRQMIKTKFTKCHRFEKVLEIIVRFNIISLNLECNISIQQSLITSLISKHYSLFKSGFIKKLYSQKNRYVTSLFQLFFLQYTEFTYLKKFDINHYLLFKFKFKMHCFFSWFKGLKIRCIVLFFIAFPLFFLEIQLIKQ